MGKNKMEEFVKLLDIKIGEYFKIRYPDGTLSSKKFYFNKEHLIEGNIYNSSNCLSEIINGRYEIVKLPWKPKIGERFFSFFVNGGSHEIQITSFLWTCDFSFQLCYRLGFVYKTREEAEAALPKAKKFFVSDEIINWEE